MTDIYDLLVQQMSTHRRVATQVFKEEIGGRTLGKCQVCKQGVFSDDQYVLEAVNSKDIRYTHWRCYGKRKKA